MTNRLPIYLFSAVIALMAAVSSCNSDPIDYGDEYKTQNVAITSFRLLKNEKVLTNIDSVFFSIDLDNRRIFNADSLPKGTRIDRLPVVIGTSSVSRVDLIVPLAQGGDTTINYLTNPKDSIDFSHGPVTVRVTSNDGMVVADYQLKVNVHEMEPDSLSWGTMAVRTLPSAFDNPVAQKTAKLGDEAAVLTTDASGNASIAFSADPGADAWSIVRTTLPVGRRHQDIRGRRRRPLYHRRRSPLPLGRQGRTVERHRCGHDMGLWRIRRPSHRLQRIGSGPDVGHLSRLDSRRSPV